MATIYSTRFFALVGLATVHTYIVPPGFVAVVRDIDAYASAGLTPKHGTFHGNNGQTIDWFVCDPDTTVTHQWRGRQVFQPGESFDYTGDGAIDVTASGYLLIAP